jgi:hypothetical protein
VTLDKLIYVAGIQAFVTKSSRNLFDTYIDWVEENHPEAIEEWHCSSTEDADGTMVKYEPKEVELDAVAIEAAPDLAGVDTKALKDLQSEFKAKRYSRASSLMLRNGVIVPYWIYFGDEYGVRIVS